MQSDGRTETWGTIAPRRRTPWQLARVVGIPGSDEVWGDADLSLQLLDGGLATLPLAKLAQPMPQLEAALAEHHGGAPQLAAHMLSAALQLKNTGIPIAVCVDGSTASRPVTLFATFLRDVGHLRVRPNHRPAWLDAHVAKHLGRAEAHEWGEAIRASGLPLPRPAVVGLARRWSRDVLQPDAWPLIEVYSLLLSEALARPGPAQLEAAVLSPGDEGLAAALQLRAARDLFQGPAGMIRARTLPGLEAMAKGAAFGLKSWATMHPREDRSFRSFLDRCQRSSVVDVQWLV